MTACPDRTRDARAHHRAGRRAACGKPRTQRGRFARGARSRPAAVLGELGRLADGADGALERSACALTSAAVCSSARPASSSASACRRTRRRSAEQVEDRVGGTEQPVDTSRWSRRSRSRISCISSACRCSGASSLPRHIDMPGKSERMAACHSRRRSWPPSSGIAGSSHPRSGEPAGGPAPPHGWRRRGSTLGSVSGDETEGATMRPKIVIAYDAHAGRSRRARARRAAGRPAWCRHPRRPRAAAHPSTEATERALQASFHATIQETRETAAEFLGDRPFEVWPVFGEPVGRRPRPLAADHGAELIVFGSPHHGTVGRVLLGNTAAAACGGRAVRRRHRAAPVFAELGAARPAGRRRRLRRLGRVPGGGRRRRSTLAHAAGAHAARDHRRAVRRSRPIRHHAPVAPSARAARLELAGRRRGGDPAARRGSGPRAAARDEDLGLLVVRLPRAGPAAAA